MTADGFSAEGGCDCRAIRYWRYKKIVVRICASTAALVTAGTNAAACAKAMSLSGSSIAKNTRIAAAIQPAVIRSGWDAGAVAMFSIARTSNAIDVTFRAPPGFNMV